MSESLNHSFKLIKHFYAAINILSELPEMYVILLNRGAIVNKKLVILNLSRIMQL